MKSYEKSLGISNTVLYFVQTGLAIYVWTLDEHIFFKSHFKMSGLPWFLRCCLKHRWILSNSSGLELEVPRSPGATISMALCSLDVGSVPCQPESPTGWCTVPEIQVLTNISILCKGNLSIRNTNQLKRWPSFCMSLQWGNTNLEVFVDTWFWNLVR